MKILDVSLDDGRKCAALINALKIAKFESLAVQDMESLVEARKWLIELATAMAHDLKNRKKEGTADPTPNTGSHGSAPVVESPQIRVKNMGPMGSAPKSRKKK